MAYATQQDIIDRYGEDQLLILADRDRDNVVDADVVARALADADAEINLHVGALYDLPLASVPAGLVQIAVDIALYRMCGTADLATEESRKRYEDARATLRRIAKREISLGPEPEQAGGLVQAPAIVGGTTRVFSRGRGGGLR